MIYMTNAIESLNAKQRPSARILGHFPSDEAAMKLIWLQLREITQKWKMPPREWSAAKVQSAVAFGDRFEVNRQSTRLTHRISDGLQVPMLTTRSLRPSDR
jgi:putative transposase